MSRTIAIYERVSTGRQDCASQHADLERWAAAYSNGEGQVVEWYSDQYTGRTLGRPGMKKLLEDIRGGGVEKVVVWRVDRLGRTVAGLSALFEELVRLGVGFVSVRDGIDLGTPAGRMVANILASVAAYEIEVSGERIRAGIRVVQQQLRDGTARWKNGQKREKYGNGPKVGQWVKVSPAVAATARRMKGEGRGVSEIARELRLSRQTVYTILEKEGEDSGNVATIEEVDGGAGCGGA